ncbi:unnamed protein product [Brassica oleracea]|uniref:(rape) hypothetical protein n=1 Tax=Brassica napus TaxID=3708 RepID=A0A816QJE3_BRANA|nr:unnamed protein product [Brassica napus]
MPRHQSGERSPPTETPSRLGERQANIAQRSLPSQRANRNPESSQLQKVPSPGLDLESLNSPTALGFRQNITEAIWRGRSKKKNKREKEEAPPTPELMCIGGRRCLRTPEPNEEKMSEFLER